MSKGKIVQLCAIDTTMEKLLENLMIAVMEAGYEVIGVCSEGKRVNKLRNKGFEIVCINIDRRIRPISNLKSIIQLYKLFKKEKPLIVHVHTPIAAVLGRIAAKLAGVKKIIYTAHGFYFHENMNPLKYKVFLHIEKFMGRFFTDFIFTQSNEDRNIAVENKFVKGNKILAIGNGVDVFGKFNPINIRQGEIYDLKKELHILKDDIIITFVGRLVGEKGVLDLLKAFEKTKNSNSRLLVVGDAWQGERDKTIANQLEKYKSIKNVIFTGERDDINNILFITDIFCLPSYREGMPRSIIEAMSMRCAVIGTNIRGIREEVVDGETGYLVKVASPEELSVRINMLLEDEKLLESMKVSGRKRAEQFYDEKTVIQSQLDVYEQLIKEQ